MVLLDLEVEACGSFYNDTMLELTPTSGKLRTARCARSCQPRAFRYGYVGPLMFPRGWQL